MDEDYEEEVKVAIDIPARYIRAMLKAGATFIGWESSWDSAVYFFNDRNCEVGSYREASDEFEIRRRPAEWTDEGIAWIDRAIPLERQSHV